MNFLLTSALILSAFYLQGQERYSVDRGEILIDGYDPISYFDGSPVKGQSLIFKEIDGRNYCLVLRKTEAGLMLIRTVSFLGTGAGVQLQW